LESNIKKHTEIISYINNQNNDEEDAEINQYKELLIFNLEKIGEEYFRIMIWTTIDIPKNVRELKNFNYYFQYFPNCCQTMFGFKVTDLPNVLKCFKLGKRMVVLPNGNSFCSEEMLLIYLTRLKTLLTLAEMDRLIFNIENTQLSRIIKWMGKYIFENFEWLLSDNL
jgi:hypothetical protein